MNQTSARPPLSPLERDWSTKPIIINNSLAFRYVTSQIWKYYGIFGFVPNERGRIHEHKAPFHKQLSTQVYSFVSLCERRVQNQHMDTVWGALFSSATHGIRCSSAGGYQTALHRCGRPLLDWGWTACIRRKASCTEPMSVPWRFDEYMYRATPNIYTSFSEMFELDVCLTFFKCY